MGDVMPGHDGKPMHDFNISLRLATREEIEEHTPDHANHVDGAGAIVVAGEIIAITNEYGTSQCTVHGLRSGYGGNVWQERLEQFAELAGDIYTQMPPL